MKLKKARVGLPEVVRLEVERHLEDDINKAASEIKSGYRLLHAVFGNLKELSLPTNTDIARLRDRIFDISQMELVQVPFSIEAAREAFLRTVDKTPPSQNSQQFKDGVIWHACKLLAAKDDVVFLTSDKAFFSKSEPEQLHEILRREISGLPFKINIVSSLDKFLEEVRETISIGPEAEEEAIAVAFGDAPKLMLDRLVLTAGPKRFAVKSFATENSNEVYVELSAEADVMDAAEPLPVGVQRFELVGTYSIEQREFQDARPRLLRVEFLEPRDGRSSSEHHYLYAEGITLGHRDAPWRLKHPLD